MDSYMGTHSVTSEPQGICHGVGSELARVEQARVVTRPFRSRAAEPESKGSPSEGPGVEGQIQVAPVTDSSSLPTPFSLMSGVRAGLG